MKQLTLLEDNAIIPFRRELTRQDAPDILWPTDNEWDIPLLNIRRQADAIHLPVMCWGAVRRDAKMRGTWVFYTDDYRFEALWKDPSSVINTGCTIAAEPNYSIGPQTPRTIALWQIYRKRWIARWWQNHGVNILVDLNVDPVYFEDIMLLGVPDGWKAYATRGYTSEVDRIALEYEMACEKAGTDDILFLVYGGGKTVKYLSRRRGWVWVPEHMDCKRGGAVMSMKEVWGNGG